MAGTYLVQQSKHQPQLHPQGAEHTASPAPPPALPPGMCRRVVPDSARDDLPLRVLGTSVLQYDKTLGLRVRWRGCLQQHDRRLPAADPEGWCTAARGKAHAAPCIVAAAGSTLNSGGLACSSWSPGASWPPGVPQQSSHTLQVAVWPALTARGPSRAVGGSPWAFGRGHFGGAAGGWQCTGSGVADRTQQALTEACAA